MRLHIRLLSKENHCEDGMLKAKQVRLTFLWQTHPCQMVWHGWVWKRNHHPYSARTRRQAGQNASPLSRILWLHSFFEPRLAQDVFGAGQRACVCQLRFDECYLLGSMGLLHFRTEKYRILFQLCLVYNYCKCISIRLQWLDMKQFRHDSLALLLWKPFLAAWQSRLAGHSGTVAL